MKLGSLFDGSGGFPLAGSISGIEPVWSSEIEKYSLEVTAKRFPNVKELGSVLDIKGAEIEPVDIITFGSPCQDLSVAGKQAGIHDGERSKLFFEAIRIIKEMRGATNGKYPRYAVWENVPGAFSTHGGADFAAVLEAFESVCEGEIIPVPVPQGGWKPAGTVVGNGWSVAWRIYDAQYWGVPQRRRRIYLVADFGSECAGEILFKCKSVPGSFEPSIKAWKDFAPHAEGGTGGSGIAFHLQQDPISDDQVSPCIGGQHTATIGVAAFMGGGNVPIVCSTVGSYMVNVENVSPTLMARDYKDPNIIVKKNDDVKRKYIVRRLTPLECGRLQGFPDWWTDDTGGSDSSRYKMWGNGIALPCATDVLWRIAHHE